MVEIEGLDEVPNISEPLDEKTQQSLVGSPPQNHNLRGDSTSICVQDFKKEVIPRLAYALLQTVFLHRADEGGGGNEGRFFSYTEVDDELSIMAEERLLERLLRIGSSSASVSLSLTSSTGSLSSSFPSSASSSSRERWKSIRVADGPLGFDECGVVSGISAALSQEKLPIMYLSTFNTDRVLVLEHNLARALQLLSKTYNILP